MNNILKFMWESEKFLNWVINIILILIVAFCSFMIWIFVKVLQNLETI